MAFKIRTFFKTGLTWLISNSFQKKHQSTKIREGKQERQYLICRIRVLHWCTNYQTKPLMPRVHSPKNLFSLSQLLLNLHLLTRIRSSKSSLKSQVGNLKMQPKPIRMLLKQLIADSKVGHKFLSGKKFSSRQYYSLTKISVTNQNL